jgi:hypothetical protein
LTDSYNPCGKIGTIGQTQVYEAAPAFEGLTDGLKPLGIIVLIPDGFGLIRHNFLLADTFAAYGWKVVVPDIYEGISIVSVGALSHCSRADMAPSTSHANGL